MTSSLAALKLEALQCELDDGSATAEDIVRAAVRLLPETLTVPEMLSSMRGIGMLTAIMRVLTHLRDRELLTLDAHEVCRHLGLRAIIQLVHPQVWPDMPEKVVRPAALYLASLPGFDGRHGENQSFATYERHSINASRFLPMFAALSVDLSSMTQQRG